MRTTEADALYRFYRSAERIGRLMRAAGDRALAPDMTMARFELLDLIRNHEEKGSPRPITPMEAADRLGLTRGSLTSLLTPLVAAGLVEASADPGDGRSKHLAMTPAGRVAHRRAMISLSVFTSYAFTVFSSDRFDSVQAVMDAYLDWLETEGRFAS